MKVNRLIAVMTALMLMSSAQAQDTFKEVSYSPEQTVFKLHAPSKVKVRIYQNDKTHKPWKTISLKKSGKDLWIQTVRGNLVGKYYTFDMGKGETPGVFAKAVSVQVNNNKLIPVIIKGKWFLFAAYILWQYLMPDSVVKQFEGIRYKCRSYFAFF